MTEPRSSSPSGPLLPTSIDKPNRRRAPHTKSRAGCISCKEKRVKCDQVRPACTRCQRTSRHAQCRYSPKPKPSFRFRAFKPSCLSSEYQLAHVVSPSHVIATTSPSPSASASVSLPLSPPPHHAIEYFCLRVLPVLRTSHPSALWDHLVVRLLHPQTSLCHIIAAIGAQQRLINEQDRHVNPLPSSQARDLYARAVSSLRASIDASADDPVDAHVLPCLLMVVLESLRGNSSNLLMHLRCGLHILRGQTAIQSDDARDAARILQHYAVQTTLFNPLSSDAQSMRAILTELFWTGAVHAEAASDPICTLSSSSTELIGLMADHYRESPSRITAPSEMSGNLPTKLQIPLLRLEKRRQLIELAIDARLFSTKCTNDVQKAVFNLAKSWCLLMKVFLTSVWTGRQTTYDAEIDSFHRIVDCAATTIAQMKSSTSNNCDAPIADSTNFTVGFSVQATLLMVLHKCRDPATRRRALDLLDQCPQHGDPCDAARPALVKALCHAILRFEGKNVVGSGASIPEDDRIHHYLLLPPTDKQQGASPIVRLYYRPLGYVGFATHGVVLDEGG